MAKGQALIVARSELTEIRAGMTKIPNATTVVDSVTSRATAQKVAVAAEVAAEMKMPAQLCEGATAGSGILIIRSVRWSLLTAPETVTYGPTEVWKAAEWGAVEHLLAIEPVDPALAALVIHFGGSIELFDADSPEYDYFAQLTGTCAVLRYQVNENEALAHTFIEANESVATDVLSNKGSVVSKEDMSMAQRASEAISGATRCTVPLHQAVVHELNALSSEFSCLRKILLPGKSPTTMVERAEGSRVCVAAYSDQKNAIGVCIQLTLPLYRDDCVEVNILHAHGLFEIELAQLVQKLRRRSILDIGVPAKHHPLRQLVLQLKQAIEELDRVKLSPVSQNPDKHDSEAAAVIGSSKMQSTAEGPACLQTSQFPGNLSEPQSDRDLSRSLPTHVRTRLFNVVAQSKQGLSICEIVKSVPKLSLVCKPLGGCGKVLRRIPEFEIRIVGNTARYFHIQSASQNKEQTPCLTSLDCFDSSEALTKQSDKSANESANCQLTSKEVELLRNSIPEEALQEIQSLKKQLKVV